jgi:branched-chain amino acid transport system ATP-binding protein
MGLLRAQREGASAVSAVAASKPAAAPLLEVRGVTRRFAGLVAVDDVSFTLAPGEIVGLIGPNGAGKTTLVSLVSGTLAPTQGEIRLDGRRIDALPAFRRAHLGIGRTFQIMRPFPGLSVLDNVAVGALFGPAGDVRTTLPKAREEARACLEFVGMGVHVDQRADQLGGPGRKRLELAKALAMQPRLLLCDEVMAGLTHVEVDEVVDVIRKVRDRGIAVLVIEHVIRAIKSLSDRLLVLHHGEKIADGAPDEVLASADVVQAYLGKRRS